MIGDKQFLFIIGAARSGTTWIQTMLGAHPSICTTAELMLFSFYVAPWKKAWQDQIRLQKYGGLLGLPILWTENELDGFLGEFLERAYARVLKAKPNAAVLLDKHPGNSENVEYIDKLVPNAKFLHIIRDGRDVGVSLVAASRDWGKLWAANNVAKSASSWKYHVLEARKARQYGDRYLEIRYEDLLTDGIEVLKSVFEFIDVPISLKELTSIFDEHRFENMKQKRTGAGISKLPAGFFRQGRKGDWSNALSATQRYVFHETAGDLLCELGYANPSWWIQYGYERFTLPFLSFLSSWNRSKRKTTSAIKRALGPSWTEQIRAARTWVKGTDNKQITENG